MTGDPRPPSDRHEWQTPRERLLPAAEHEPSLRRSVLLEVVTRVLYPSVLVVAVYLLFVGAYRNGGGFTAGLVAGAGVSLRFLAGGPREFGTAMPVNPAGLLGAGLAIMAGYGLVGAAVGVGALSSTTWGADLPVFGHVEVSSAVIFELGVAVLVVGLVADVLRVMGPGLGPDDADESTDDAEAEQP